MGLQFETLRLFPPLLHISRATDMTQTITAHGKTFTSTARSRYSSTTCSCTRTPTPGATTLWSSAFALDRAGFHARQRPAGDLFARGTFSAWSGGRRACPGMKMSQA